MTAALIEDVAWCRIPVQTDHIVELADFMRLIDEGAKNIGEYRDAEFMPTGRWRLELHEGWPNAVVVCVEYAITKAEP